MMKYTTRIGAALFLALPAALTAQETVTEEAAPEAAEICVATIAEPIEIGTLNAVSVNFDAPFGAIVGLEAPEGSGLLLAEAPEDAELIDVADEGAEIEIQAAGDDVEVEIDAEGNEVEVEVEAEGEAEIEAGNSGTFWIDAAAATVGTHEITLWNESEASCQAEITVIDVVEATDEAETMDESVEAEEMTDDAEKMDAESDEDTSDEESGEEY